MSRRASLPGAEELFRKTSDRTREPRPSSETSKQDAKSTKLQVATPTSEVTEAARPKAPKHEEKITFYCTPDDLMAIERTRLELRAAYGLSADRGRRGHHPARVRVLRPERDGAAHALDRGRAGAP